jgi:hypothetical protein
MVPCILGIEGTHVEHDVGTCGLTCASYDELKTETCDQNFSTYVEPDALSCGLSFVSSVVQIVEAWILTSCA